MICKRCGSKNDEQAKFCGSCGMLLVSDVSEKQNSKEVINQKETKGHGERRKIIIVMVFMALAAGILAVSLIHSRREEMGQAKEIMADPQEEQIGITEKSQGVSTEKNYTWIVEPIIDADEIYYEKLNNLGSYSWNELNLQFINDYAIIKKGDALGLIGMDGQLNGGMDYKKISYLVKFYILERISPQYEPEMQREWSYYMLRDGRIEPEDGLGSINVTSRFYYYNNDLHDILEGSEYSTLMLPIPDVAIPVQQSEIKAEPETKLSGKYAVYSNGTLVTGFIYDQCGSCSSGLLAVEKDGKWGYVNEAGKEVIPIEYDTTWNYFKTDNYENRSYCYAASEGYVPLRKGDKWEMKNKEGEIVIESDVFDEILPVYKGKCWVKKDGKWGVIQIAGDSREN